MHQCTRWNTLVVFLAVLLLFLTVQGGGGSTSHSRQPWDDHLRHLKPSSSPQQQVDAVRELLKRLIQNRSAEFDIKVDPIIGSLDKDTFKIDAENGSVHIIGSTGVAASNGVLYYLKYSCFCHVSWEADQLDLPPKLPDATVEKTTLERYRYYFNICTLSYSTSFWTWEQWERGIDWMALNGINLILAPMGQEDSWRKVFLNLGLTEEDLVGYFAGPPFLAWNRMGNIQGWGGPLSQNWTSQRSALNKRIVDRMREFGMKAILPAFAGHVPEGLQRVFPNANISRLSAWGHFTDPYTRTFFLDPRDPLFKTIGSAFIKEINDTFGSDHLYSCDPFNEMTPVSSNLEYLRSLGVAVLGAMTDVDPTAVWVMQGWMFVSDPGFWKPPQAKALLTSVPQGKMLILDLAAETLPQYLHYESFYGQPFIFCMLHNYGGVQGLFGNVDVLLKHLEAARAPSDNITLVGTGLTPEGINQNYVMYDFFMDLIWPNSVNVSQWAVNYAKRRYGSPDTRLGEAWQKLMSSVYSCNTVYYNHGQYVLVTRPDVEKAKDELWYSVADLLKAWDLIIAVAKEAKEHPPSQAHTQTPASSLCPSERTTVGEPEQIFDVINPPQSTTPTLLQQLQNIIVLDEYSKESNMVWYKHKRDNRLWRERRSSGFVVNAIIDEERREMKMEEQKRKKMEERIVLDREYEERSRRKRKPNKDPCRNLKKSEEKSIADQETFKHDLVDITRQMLQLIGGNMALRVIDDYKNGVLLALRESSHILQVLLLDMERLLASSPAFLLGNWIQGAASWASSEQERNQFIENALHQITLWGPTGELVDYAIKQWSGILSDYLRERWALFSERLEDSLVSGKNFSQTQFNFDVFMLVEKKFANNVNASYPTLPTGNTLDIALQLYERYRPVFDAHLLEVFENQYRNSTNKMQGKKRKEKKEEVDEDGAIEDEIVRKVVQEERQSFYAMMMK